ncbi:MAG: hypothetical protein ACLU4J_27170 [Butyricimonas paravirosa]
MDNAVRLIVRDVKGELPKAWSMSLGVDLNTYLYDEKMTLARFARLLNWDELANQLEKDAVFWPTGSQIMFDDENGYFLMFG